MLTCPHDARRGAPRHPGYAGANRIGFTRHADQRRRERGAEYQDIRFALMTAATCSLEGAPDKWRVPSADRDGEPLTLIVVLEGRVLVVTLFG